MNPDLHDYLMNEGLSTWHLRRFVAAARSLRLAAFNPGDGGMLAMEAELIGEWTRARR